MTVDIKTDSSVPTNDFINVNVDAVAKVRIDTRDAGLKLAAKNFLNKQAEAEKFAKLQSAEGIKAVGLAEAEATKARALAEAEGIDKKADAMAIIPN